MNEKLPVSRAFFLLLVVILVAVFAWPPIALAQLPLPAPSPSTGGGQDPPPSIGGGTLGVSIKNPLKAESIAKLIKVILEIIVRLGAPIVTIFIVYSGLLFVTARGNETKLAAAKQTFFWTVIGAAIVLGAFVILAIIQNTISAIRS